MKKTHLEKCAGRQSDGASRFFPVPFDVSAAKFFERLSLYFLDLVKDAFHAYSILAYDPPMVINSVVGGVEVHVHLVVPELVDHQH